MTATLKHIATQLENATSREEFESLSCSLQLAAASTADKLELTRLTARYINRSMVRGLVDAIASGIRNASKLNDRKAAFEQWSVAQHGFEEGTLKPEDMTELDEIIRYHVGWPVAGELVVVGLEVKHPLTHEYETVKVSVILVSLRSFAVVDVRDSKEQSLFRFFDMKQLEEVVADYVCKKS